MHEVTPEQRHITARSDDQRLAALKEIVELLNAVEPLGVFEGRMRVYAQCHPKMKEAGWEATDKMLPEIEPLPVDSPLIETLLEHDRTQYPPLAVVMRRKPLDWKE